MQPGMGVPSAQEQANLLKDKGNQYFKKEKLGAAIEAYTEAITLCPSVPLYWTNRALCERKRCEWEKVEADCRKALQLDNHCVKAYYLLGLALVHYQQYEEAVKQLEKAMDLGRGLDGNYMVEEIWQELAKARFAEWEAVSDIRQRQQLDLKLHLSDLLREDYEKKLNEAIASLKAANNSVSGAGIQGSLPVEVDDLIRFDSGSRQGSGSTGLKQSSGNGRGEFYPISELERLLRSQSEPASVFLKAAAGNEEAFDPLKQHKLSRRNSKSLWRQRSETFSVSNNASAKPVVKEELQPAVAAAGVDMQRGETPRPAAPPKSEPSASAASAAEGKNDNNGTPYVQSIYEVFKVFKEFMKLQQNEAGQKLLRLSEQYQRRSQVLDDVFEKAAAADQQVEIPDHLCCKITMDIFRDPVVSTSGITYERAALLDHIRKVGHFDPITRKPLTVEQVVPNLALKEAVHAFLYEHGWAYGPC